MKSLFISLTLVFSMMKAGNAVDRHDLAGAPGWICSVFLAVGWLADSGKEKKNDR